MKKIFILLALSLVFTACGNKKSEISKTIDELQEFVEKISKNAANFTMEEWDAAENKYEEFIAKLKAKNDKITDEERSLLHKLDKTFENTKEIVETRFQDNFYDAEEDLDDLVENSQEDVSAAVDTAKETIGELAEQAKALAKEAAEELAEQAEKIAEKTKEAAEKAKETAEKLSQEAADKAKEAAEKAKKILE